jgi:hypothetical protein
MKSVAVLALLPLALAFPSSFSSPVPALLLANTPSLTDKPIPGVLIDVSGIHKWVPPDLQAGDMRGVCPGLNALANHNYLPHNGMITYVQGVSVTEDSKETPVSPFFNDLSCRIHSMGFRTRYRLFWYECGDGLWWQWNAPFDRRTSIRQQCSGCSDSWFVMCSPRPL